MSEIDACGCNCRAVGPPYPPGTVQAQLAGLRPRVVRPVWSIARIGSDGSDRLCERTSIDVKTGRGRRAAHDARARAAHQ